MNLKRVKMDIENLKALVYGHELTNYQRILAIREFEAMKEVALIIDSVMQSCDTCKHLSTCKFWQEAPNNGATCKFYIEHVGNMPG